jgi:hypothetical protein
LATLARLPQLVATGLLSTQRSNAMVQALSAMLKNMPDEAPGQNGKVESDQLRNVLREQPDLLHALGPLLSDEQLAELSDDEEEHDDDDGGGPGDEVLRQPG